MREELPSKALSERQSRIMRIAREQGTVDVLELARQLKVTEQSVRRDLSVLANIGMLQRRHGGATLADGVVNLDYRARRRLATAAKQRIGAAAAAIIPNNSSLFINIGTTTESVVRHLHAHRGLLVITNNINVANQLLPCEDITLIVAGGAVRHSDGGIVGEMAEDTVARYKTDIAVIGASAIDSDGALLDYDHREVRIARAIISNSHRVLLVADATKFSRRAPVRIGTLSDVGIFITDRPPPLPLRRLCQRHKTDIIVAK